MDDVIIMLLDEIKKKHLRIIILETIVVIYQIFLLIMNTISWNNMRKSIFFSTYTILERNISILLSFSLLICIVGLAIMLELRIKYLNKERNEVFKMLEEKFVLWKRLSLVIFTTGFVVLIGISAYALYVMLHYGWIAYWNL